MVPVTQTLCIVDRTSCASRNAILLTLVATSGHSLNFISPQNSEIPSKVPSKTLLQREAEPAGASRATMKRQRPEKLSGGKKPQADPHSGGRPSALTGYLASCCLSDVSNQSAHSHVLPRYQQGLFLPMLVGYFLLLGL